MGATWRGKVGLGITFSKRNSRSGQSWRGQVGQGPVGSGGEGHGMGNTVIEHRWVLQPMYGAGDRFCCHNCFRTYPVDAHPKEIARVKSYLCSEPRKVLGINPYLPQNDRP